MCASLIELLSKGGFQLSQLMTSSLAVLESVQAESRVTSTLNLNFEDLPEERTLGLRWECQADCFVFSLSTHITPTTKREMLSAVNKVYDPLGFMTCIITPCRILLQDVWRLEQELKLKGDNWDRKLPDCFIQRWKKITRNWQKLSSLKIPRCLNNIQHPETTHQLHVYCDATLTVMGAVAYLRSESPEKVTVTFIAAKSKMVSLTPITIPQCELKAASLATKLELKSTETHTPKSEKLWPAGL